MTQRKKITTYLRKNIRVRFRRVRIPSYRDFDYREPQGPYIRRHSVGADSVLVLAGDSFGLQAYM